MKKRNETRLEKKLLVSVENNGFDSIGLTANISKNGMFITTTEVLPIDSEVSLLLGIADETFPLKGQVMWSQEWKNRPSPDTRAATGIKITEAPEQYVKYVEKMLSD